MTESRKIDEVLNGKIRIWRFNESEQAGCADAADRFLWLCILRAEDELSGVDTGAISKGDQAATSGSKAPCRFLKDLSEELPPTFAQLLSVLGSYKDRGRESIVCDSGDGYVRKIRLLRPSVFSGYIAPFAAIVYHNRLFPSVRYTLENLYRRNNDYFMVLRQPRVDILLDENGYPIKPSTDMLIAAINEIKIGLEPVFVSEDEDLILRSSTDRDDGEKLRFYNCDYYISDLQPGRNTVIDASSGRVEFIDPRIMLNDPDGPITGVEGFGLRHELMPGQVISEIAGGGLPFRL